MTAHSHFAFKSELITQQYFSIIYQFFSTNLISVKRTAFHKPMWTRFSTLYHVWSYLFMLHAVFSSGLVRASFSLQPLPILNQSGPCGAIFSWLGSSHCPFPGPYWNNQISVVPGKLYIHWVPPTINLYLRRELRESIRGEEWRVKEQHFGLLKTHSKETEKNIKNHMIKK